MAQEKSQSISTVIGWVVISISVSGYFAGLQSPIKQASVPASLPGDHIVQTEARVLPATAYADVGPSVRSLRDLRENQSSLTKLLSTSPSNHVNSNQVNIVKSEEQKALALAEREQLRAFNGAPPTIPHPIDQISSESCMVCHAEGGRTKSLRIGKMPHPYYANCTQCHVESNRLYRQASAYGEKEVAETSAPYGTSDRPASPPQIPHSTWMRSTCLSCHGFTGNRGLQTTHPWRQNCLQCHTASAESDQLPIRNNPSFLAPPIVNQQ